MGPWSTFTSQYSRNDYQWGPWSIITSQYRRNDFQWGPGPTSLFSTVGLASSGVHNSSSAVEIVISEGQRSAFSSAEENNIEVQSSSLAIITIVNVWDNDSFHDS